MFTFGLWRLVQENEAIVVLLYQDGGQQVFYLMPDNFWQPSRARW